MISMFSVTCLETNKQQMANAFQIKHEDIKQYSETLAAPTKEKQDSVGCTTQSTCPVNEFLYVNL